MEFPNKLKLLFLVASRNLISRKLRTFVAITSIALMIASYIISTAITETLTASAISPSTSLLFGENSFTLAWIWLAIIFLIATFLLIFNSLISSVFDRLYEMGVWAFVGATPFDIATITVMEAIVLGLLGGLLGYVIIGGTLIVASCFSIPVLPSLPSRLGFQGLLTSLSMALLICIIATSYPYVKATRLGSPVVKVRGKFLPIIIRKSFAIKKEKLPLVVNMSEVEGLFLFIKSLKEAAIPSMRRFHNFWGVNMRKNADGRIEKALGFRCDLTIIPSSFADITLVFEQMHVEQEAAEVYITIIPAVVYAGMSSRSRLSRIAGDAREGMEALLSRWRTESKRKIT